MAPNGSAWYPDPIDPSRIRLHDGQRWTDRIQAHVSDVSPPNEAGWYPDPLDSGRLRYFDGTSWSDQIHSPGTVPSTSVGAAQEKSASHGRDDPHDDAMPPRRAARGRKWAWVAAFASAALVVGVGLVIATSDWRARTGAETAPTPDVTDAVTETALPRTSASASLPTSSTPAPLDDRPPILGVKDVTASSEMWSASWQRVEVEDATPGIAERIRGPLEDFSDEPALGLIGADPLDPAEYNSISGRYNQTIEILNCPEPLLCLVRRASVFPPGGGSGMGTLDTLVLDHTTGAVVEIADVVSEEQLPGLAAAAERAVVTSSDMYRDIPVSLPPDYEIFANFIPQDDGVRLYFSEYVIGPTPVEIFVGWGDMTLDAPSEVLEPPEVSSALAYICSSSSALKPPLVGADSDAEATRAIQALLPWQFGYDPGPLDGQYGPRTIAAVKQMQSDLGVVPDGQIGPITWAALQRRVCTYP